MSRILIDIREIFSAAHWQIAALPFGLLPIFAHNGEKISGIAVSIPCDFSLFSAKIGFATNAHD